MNDRLQPATAPARKLRLSAMVAALAVYIALWGSLCSMDHLSSAGVLPLCAGGAVIAVLCLMPRGNLRLGCAALVLIAVALLTLLQWERFSGGCRLFVNRLFDASEATQRYLYERFPVTFGPDALQYALLPFALLSGLVCALAASCRLRPALVGLIAALCLLMAYLGLTPSLIWLFALAVAAVLTLLPPQVGRPHLWQLIPLLLAAAICLAVVLLLPGEDAALAGWSEHARDVLAPHTVAYGEQLQTQAPETVPPEHRDFRQLDAPETDQTPEPASGRTLGILLLLLFVALVLFVPSILSDRLRKKRAQARAGLDAAEHAAYIRAAFLYAMRWLRFGGLSSENIPYSWQAPQVAAQFPQLSDSYRAVLPLWQEAAYSGHAMTQAQREQMQSFLTAAKSAAEERMRRLQRLRAKLTL